jgi:hypothetical protein
LESRAFKDSLKLLAAIIGNRVPADMFGKEGKG